MGSLVGSTKEASKGGFAGIKKIRGLMVECPSTTEELVNPPEGWESTKKQVLVKMEDTVVLEMSPGEEIFELRDKKFSFYVPYAEAGKAPNANSIYTRCWVASAEALGKKPWDFKGQYVTLEKKRIVLFKKPVLDETTKKPKLDAEGKKILEEIATEGYFCFVADETADGESTKAYIKGLVTGLNETAAKRKLLVDSRAKQFPEFKAALDNGKLGELLGLELKDGKFVETSGKEASADS